MTGCMSVASAQPPQAPAISHRDVRSIRQGLKASDVVNSMAVRADSRPDAVMPVVPMVVRMGVCAAFIVLMSGCVLRFPTDAGDDLSHFNDLAPRPGQVAPNVKVRMLDGSEVELFELLQGRPVVLQLGSHSCPVYRYRRFDMFELQDEYRERVDFVVVYTTEAHPVGAPSPYRDEEWLTFINRVTNTRVPQSSTIEQRISQAAWSTRELERTDLVVVDGMENRAWRSFGAAPTAAFVLDGQGNVVLTQPWVEPDGIRAALDRLLRDSE